MGAPCAALAAALVAVACLSAAAPARAATPLNDPLAPTRSGRVLNSDTGNWLCIGGCTYTYAWQRCAPGCQTISGASGPTYVLRTPDIGASIRSLVTANDALGSSTRPSEPTAPVAAAPPVNVAPPAVTGTPRVGSVLGSTPGTWSDPSPANVAYARAWVRCTTLATDSCVPISTAPTYAPSAPDVGRFIRRLEVADGLGTATAFSLPVGAVQPAPAGTPFSSGGGSGPAGGTGARRLRPFPVVVIAGRLRRGRTVISEFVVRGPRRARVQVRCRGRGCPFRRISHTIGRRKRVRVRRAERSYRAGTVVEVRVTAPNRIGKFTRLRFHGNRAPGRRDLCLRPGARRPTRCA